MADVIVLEYQVSERQHFVSCYKTNLLPIVRKAQGFRHIQLARRGVESMVILIEFAFVADYVRFKRGAPPQTFPPEQDLLSEEVLGTLPNTSFPLANARHYQPPVAKRRQQTAPNPDHAAAEGAVVRDSANNTKPLRQRHRGPQHVLRCPKCHEQPEIFIKALAPHYEAYRQCRCGNERIDHVVTIRWMEVHKSK